MKSINVYLETGDKKTFAGAVDWPGWCRTGKDEKSALQALFDYQSRYAKAIRSSGVDFPAGACISDFIVIERLKGNATTDFGAPAVPPSIDASPISDPELNRLQKILESCWNTFDQTVKSAAGKQLRLGPRGGGRDLQEIEQHVLEAGDAYLAKISWKKKALASADLLKTSTLTRQAVMEALAGAAGKTAEPKQTRGGVWTKRYFIRRLAWHLLDHAWEIEDRTI